MNGANPLEGVPQVIEPALITRRYEMMIVVAPTVTEQGLPAVIDRVVNYVDTHGGEVEGLTYENPWGRRRLAYPINNYQDAFYVLLYFNAVADAITPLERSLRLDEQVIRHLIVKYDPLADYLEMPTLRRPGEVLVEEIEEEVEELIDGEVVAEAEAIIEAEALDEGSDDFEDDEDFDDEDDDYDDDYDDDDES